MDGRLKSESAGSNQTAIRRFKNHVRRLDSPIDVPSKHDSSHALRLIPTPHDGHAQSRRHGTDDSQPRSRSEYAECPHGAVLRSTRLRRADHHGRHVTLPQWSGLRAHAGAPPGTRRRVPDLRSGAPFVDDNLWPGEGPDKQTLCIVSTDPRALAAGRFTSFLVDCRQFQRPLSELRALESRESESMRAFAKA